MTMPASPSKISQSSSAINSLPRPKPMTAGTFMLRAKIALCEVAPPRSIAKPSACFSVSMSAGAKSDATTMAGSSVRSCC